MTIICDKDSDPPEVPEIKSYEDFKEFIFSEFPRLDHYGIRKASYLLLPYAAEICASDEGYSGSCYHLEISS